MASPAQDELFGYTEGYYITRALLAAWRIGLLDTASEVDALDAEAWAAAHDCDPGLLRSLLDYLVTRDFFEVNAGQYRLSERGRQLIPYAGYLPMQVGAYEPIFTVLEEVLHGRRRYGQDLGRAEAELVAGMSAMEEHLLAQLTAITEDLPFRGVLDLGCGSGRVLSTLLARAPHLRGVGIDREPAACAEARRTLARAGQQDRAVVINGDAAALRDLPPDLLADVDLAIAMFLMHEIYHHRSRDEMVDLFRAIGKIIGPQGRLLLVEVSRLSGQAPRRGLRFVPEYQLLHDFSQQRLASKQEWQAMLAEAGLQVLRTEPAGMCEAFCFVAAPVAAG